MKSKSTLLVFAAAGLLALPVSSHARSKAGSAASASPSATASTAAAKATASPATAMASTRAVPFHGMISAVDANAKTFTIAGKSASRTFKITDKTMVSKAGAAATIKDVVANEEARGSYLKTGDGSLEAKTLKLGPLTEQEKAAKDARKAKRAAKKDAASSSTSPAGSMAPAASASPSAH